METGAEFGGQAAMAIEAAGAVVAVGGLVSGAEPVAVVGGAMMATAGLTNFAASGFQTLGGALQVAGGASATGRRNVGISMSSMMGSTRTPQAISGGTGDDSEGEQSAEGETQGEQQKDPRCMKPAEDRSFADQAADTIVGFGDVFLIPILVRDLFDISGNIDFDSSAYTGGMITGTVWGSAPFALRGAAALGGTRFGHVLNHNPNFRIGPGRWGGPMVPRVSSPHLPGDGHLSLTTRLPPPPPVGALASPDGC